MSPIKYSCIVVGLGQIGMGYDLSLNPDDKIYSHARAFSVHPNFDLACGVDPSSERRDIFTKEHGRPAFATIEEALNVHVPDVVAIATPTPEHASTVRKLLTAAKPRAILCEKPLAETVAEADALVEMCSKANVGLYVNYMRRSIPGAIEVKRMIDSGEIAAPIRGVIWYSKGFIHNGSHFFNLAEFWLGKFKDAHVADRGRDFGEFDAEPEVKAVFANGEVTFIPAWEEHFSHYTVELLSATGRLYWGQGNLSWQEATDDPILKPYKVLPHEAKQIPTEIDRYQWHVADQLSRAIAGEEASICTAQQALDTLSTMSKILEMRYP